jgi:hypothetical protein
VVEGCSRLIAATDAANRTMDVNSIGRTPRVSIRRPKNGVARAVRIDELPMAVEIVPRPNPSSCATGFMNTPAANTLIAPCPTTTTMTHLLRTGMPSP